MKILVAQIGARRHYAVPRTLHANGLLDRLFTDICATKGWPKLLKVFPRGIQNSPGIKRLLERVPTGIPSEMVDSFSALGLRLNRRLRATTDQALICEILQQESASFCRAVLRRGWGRADAVYTFNGAGLEILKAAKSQGLFTVMEQTIAPMQVELRLMQEERLRHPRWQDGLVPSAAVTGFIEREQAEWQYADVILCGSEFVRDGIIECGGPGERCVVVPYGLDRDQFQPAPRHVQHSETRPLRVLSVGVAGLRKGTPYVIESAKRLAREVQFRWVGQPGVLRQAVDRLPDNIEFVGSVPRSQVSEHFKWADVFLLPSICEGSAMVTYEALSAGVPVICTPNTGSVVRNGIEGFVVPNGNVDEIIRALRSVAQEPNLLGQMSDNAALRSEDFSLEKYEANLVRSIVRRHPTRSEMQWS